MADAKTRATNAGVAAHLDEIAGEARRRDRRTLSAMTKRATGCAPTTWGDAIVGSDTCPSRSADGREADCPLVAFSSREGDISACMLTGAEGEAGLLAQPDRQKSGKARLHVRRLQDVDLAVLEQFVAPAAATGRRYPKPALWWAIAAPPAITWRKQ